MPEIRTSLSYKSIPPKAANELERIRRARRWESKTRVSLVNLGMICRQFETVRHFLRPLARGVRLKSSIPSPSSLLPELGVVHKSRFIFRRLCVPTYVYLPIYFRPRHKRLACLFRIWEMRLLNPLVSPSKPTVKIKYPALPEGVQSCGVVI